MADTPRLIETRNAKYARVPSSLAWMVEKAIEEALVKVSQDHPAFAHDAVEGTTLVLLVREP